MNSILIIDDEESARDLLRRLLEQEGYEVVAAKNGQEGVEIFRKTAGLIWLSQIWSCR